MDYTIYGAGDRASHELRELCTKLGLSFRFVDIRVQVAATTEPLTFLISRRLTTVPQVFGADGTHIGNFESALQHWKSRND